MMVSMFAGLISSNMAATSSSGACGISSTPTLEGGHAEFAQLV
jgi:hypothetical protein